MTEKTIPVEWALQGKTLGREGARVLACSSGKLSRENFTELLGRFNLGTPDELPQMSVSYLASRHLPGRGYYLGMAIHKWATDVQTDGGELLEQDDDNRPVAVTAYFGVPYQPLADAGVSYQAMYQEFNNLRLSTADGPPFQVEFPVRTGLPVIDPLIMQAASRLFAGQKVCVRGAESTSVAERLEFIGTVAALLPYGFRTRLAAATWVRPTHRGHRFRLFFSEANRDVEPADDVVWWGDPDRTALTPRDDLAYTYQRRLAGTLGRPLKFLADLKTPRSFTDPEIRASLDEIWKPRRKPGKPDKPEPEQPPPDSRVAPTVESPVQKKDPKYDGEQILYDCATFLKEPNVANLTVAITQLESWAGSKVVPGPGERHRYQEIIKEQHLFRHDNALSAGLEKRLRAALLKAAFNPPLSYTSYCVIEDSLGSEAPDEALLKMIVNAGMPDSDIQIKAVVFGQLLPWPRPIPEIAGKLDGWYKSQSDPAQAVQLIAAVAGRWHGPRHALWAGQAVADLMRRHFYRAGPIRSVLELYGYLAHALHAAGDGDDDTQVTVLLQFLKTAHPHQLSARDFQQILIERREPPSPALLAAVLLWLADAYEANLAREAYVFGAIQAMNLQPERRETLRSHLAFAEWPDGPAVGPSRHSATGPT